MVSRASIRVHVLRLVLAVALPLAALLAWILYTGAQAEARHAREQVVRFAQITASSTERFLAQTQDVLNGLAARPAVNALDPRHCDPVLKDVRALAPRFANVATLALDGRVICSAQPTAPGARGKPENFLKLMRGPHDLTVGKAAPGVITGKWVVPIGRPLLDSRGEVAGAVVLPVDLVNFPVLSEVSGLPADTVVGIIAGDGTVLARSLDAERHVGKKLGAGRSALRETSGTAEVIGIDGIPRIQGFAPVPGTDWIALASVPASNIYADIRARTVTSALIALAILAATLLLAVRWSRAIAEPIAALAATAQGDGKPAVRGPVTGAAEIAEAAAQFKLLFDSRARARTGLRVSEERFAGVIASAMDAIITVNEDQEILIFNPAAEAMFGRRREDVLGKRLDVVIPEQFRAAHSGHIGAFGKAGVTSRAMGRLGQIIGLRADGTVFPIEASISQTGTAPGKLFTVILRDVSERQRTEESLRTSLSRQRELSRRLQESEENERRRINRELHDRVGQSLSMLNLNLDLIRTNVPRDALQAVGRRLEDAQTLVADTTAQIRNLMADLHPPALDDFGLLAALRTFGETLSTRAGIPVAVSGAEASPRLARAVEMALFRVAEGALANAVKHAHASRIEVNMAAAAERVLLTVADDGKGIESNAGSGSASWGLTIMRERAEAVGASLRIDSSPGAGTRVIVEVTREAA